MVVDNHVDLSDKYLTTCYIERVLSCQVITVNDENLKLTFKTVRKSVSWMAHNLGHVFMLR